MEAAGQDIIDKAIRETQVQAMHLVHTQLVTYLTQRPSVTSWPVAVRKHIYGTLSKSLELFGPQSEEEEAFYREDVPHS